MREIADVRVLQPVAFMPVVKPLPPWARRSEHEAYGLRIEPQPMLYVPGVLKSLDALWLARSIRRVIARHIQTRRVDAIDAHFGYPDGVGCVRVARSLRLPAFVTIRGSETDFLRTPGIGAQLVAALNAATGCISVSHSLRELAISYGVEGERVRVIPNAVDRRIFAPGSRELARRSLGLDGAQKIIVSVGHLISGKRHHVVVQALSRVREHFPNAVLAIIGGAAYDREYPAYLERVVREQGLGNHVRMIGRVPQATVSSWLRAADVFALATEREGCCNAVLEALAAGLPVITTPVGDNAHFVRPGVNGALVPVDDVSGFAGALTRALGREWDAQEISRALDVGNWDDVARRVIDFIDERTS